MTIEADLYDTLKPLVGNRVFPDVAPLTTAKPYITYTQIGGEAVSYVENTVPDLQNGRYQVNVWGATRSQCALTMLQVEAALVAATAYSARPVSAPSSEYDHDMAIYSAMQDFSVWSKR